MTPCGTLYVHTLFLPEFVGTPRNSFEITFARLVSVGNSLESACCRATCRLVQGNRTAGRAGSFLSFLLPSIHSTARHIQQPVSLSLLFFLCVCISSHKPPWKRRPLSGQLVQGCIQQGRRALWSRERSWHYCRPCTEEQRGGSVRIKDQTLVSVGSSD